MTLEQCRNNIGNLVIVKFNTFIIKWEPQFFILESISKDITQLFPILVRNIEKQGVQAASVEEILCIINKDNKLVKLLLE
jgi:hypothetical protein